MRGEREAPSAFVALLHRSFHLAHTHATIIVVRDTYRLSDLDLTPPLALSFMRATRGTDGRFIGAARQDEIVMGSRTVRRVALAVVLWVAIIFGSIFLVDELVSIIHPAGLPGEIGESEVNTFMVAGSVGAAIVIGLIVFLDLSR